MVRPVGDDLLVVDQAGVPDHGALGQVVVDQGHSVSVVVPGHAHLTVHVGRGEGPRAVNVHKPHPRPRLPSLEVFGTSTSQFG